MGGEKVEYGYKGKGSLIHLITDAGGNPLYATLTAANGDERLELPKLLDKLKVMGMSIVEADKGYDSKAVRLEILNKGHYPIIPYRGKKKGVDKWVTRMRWKVERCFSWLNRSYRRIATRWERLSSVYEAFVLLGISLFWIRKLVG
jgi:transposase